MDAATLYSTILLTLVLIQLVNGQHQTNDTQIITSAMQLSATTQEASYTTAVTPTLQIPSKITIIMVNPPLSGTSSDFLEMSASSQPAVSTVSALPRSEMFVVSLEIKSSDLSPPSTAPDRHTVINDTLSAGSVSSVLQDTEITSHQLVETIPSSTLQLDSVIEPAVIHSTVLSGDLISSSNILSHASSATSFVESTPTLVIDDTSFVVTAPVWEAGISATVGMTDLGSSFISSASDSYLNVQSTILSPNDSVISIIPRMSDEILDSSDNFSTEYFSTTDLFIESTEIVAETSAEEVVASYVMNTSLIDSTDLTSDPAYISQTVSALIASDITPTETDIYPSSVWFQSTRAPYTAYTLRVQLSLTGNCTVLEIMTSNDGLREFRRNLVSALAVRLSFPADKVVIKDVQCGSLMVLLDFVNVTEAMDLEESLQSLQNGTQLFGVGNDTYVFSIIKVDVLSNVSPIAPLPPTIPKANKLTDIQIIIIIVCSVVGGTLILYAIGFCIYACCQKRKSKSFDLGETPISTMTMEDFTLTKMQRPPSIYTEQGLVLPSAANGRARPRRIGHYQSIDDEMQILAPEDIHLADTLPRRTVDPSHQENKQQYMSDELHSSGFDNPSFSSDDLLDCGAAGSEVPLDASNCLQHEVEVLPTTLSQQCTTPDSATEF